MKFFFDRCISRRLAHTAAALETGAHTICHHDDDQRFRKDTKDIEWLAALGKDTPPWIVVSGDSRVLTRTVERVALSEANLMYFVMSHSWCNTPFDTYVWKFFKVWPDIVKAARINTPTVFEIGGGKNLKIKRLERSRR
jgi:hypothetical protein